jgi:hypothetical protein
VEESREEEERDREDGRTSRPSPCKQRHKSIITCSCWAAVSPIMSLAAHHCSCSTSAKASSASGASKEEWGGHDHGQGTSRDLAQGYVLVPRHMSSITSVVTGNWHSL